MSLKRPNFFVFLVVMGYCFSQLAALPARGEQITAFTAIEPYAFFVEQISGNAVRVETLVSSGKDPHTFEPTPSRLSKLSSGKIYFKTGMPFEERLLEKFPSLFPHLKVVDTNKGIIYRKMENDKHGSKPHIHDNHKRRGEHKSKDTNVAHINQSESSHGNNHSNLDPHVWLSPKNAKMICENIAETLSSFLPEYGDLFRNNTQHLKQALDLLDSNLSDSLSKFKGKSFYVYHPAFGYLADDYGLVQRAVEIEGKEPTAKQLARLIDSARRENVSVVFVAPQFSKKGANTLAQGINGVVVEIDPLERNYIANLEKIVQKIHSSLK
ncbi:MAG: metal ABC transporter solute-binding protein, Zn/Mn family [Desulfomonilaceae bacterium]